MKDALIYLLGGRFFSGAEKRLLLTALQMPAQTGRPVGLYLNRHLHDAIAASPQLAAQDLAALRIVREPHSPLLQRLRGGNALLRLLGRLRLLRRPPAIAHFALFNLLDVLLGGLLRLRGVRVYHEITSPDVARSTAVRLLLACPRLSDGLICVSDNVLRLCRERARPGVPLRVRQQPYVEAPGQPAPPFAERERLVLYAHRLMPRKNPLLAVEAFARLAGDYPDWQFHICGQGPQADAVAARIAAAGHANLRYLGYVSDLDQRIARAQVFVSLIEPDNYPSQSVLEALAAGCALLLADTGQSREKFLAAPGANGEATALDPRACAAALRRLLDDPQLDGRGSASSAFFAAHYSQTRYLEESAAFYR